MAGTRSYTIYDLVGAVDSWYRLRYTKFDGTSPSAYSTAFQSGDESGGFICSVYDVEQRLGGTASANDRETIIEFIRAVTVGIEGYCGRWFVPRPLSGTATYRVHTAYGRVIRLPKGIRSVTTLGLATIDQPATGGTYTTATATDYYLDPPEMERDAGWPATRLCLRSSAGTTLFAASYGAEITGAFGWASVPPDVADIGTSAVIRKFMGKETASPAIAVGPSGAVTLLRDLSPADMGRLDWYRQIP